MMEVLLHVFCSTLPVRLLAYAPFLDRLRFGKQVAVATLTVSMLLDLLAEQKKHSQLMVEHMSELRRQRHDLRHQLAVIQGLAGTDNPQLKAYINELLDAIPTSPQIYCENQAVNAIVSHYAAMCSKRGGDARFEPDGRVFRSSVYVRI